MGGDGGGGVFVVLSRGRKRGFGTSKGVQPQRVQSGNVHFLVAYVDQDRYS